MSDHGDCLFCRIANGDGPAEVVADNELAVGFRDINPKAPTHVLVVPKRHHADVRALAEDDPESLIGVLRLVGQIADSEGLDGSYRVVFNTGPGAGQSVFHAHAHLLGGRSLTWPPG